MRHAVVPRDFTFYDLLRYLYTIKQIGVDKRTINKVYINPYYPSNAIQNAAIVGRKNDIT